MQCMPLISLENAFLKREKVFSSLRIPTRNHFKRKTEGDRHGCLVLYQICSFEIIRKKESVFYGFASELHQKKSQNSFNSVQDATEL